LGWVVVVMCIFLEFREFVASREFGESLEFVVAPGFSDLEGLPMLEPLRLGSIQAAVGRGWTRRAENLDGPCGQADADQAVRLVALAKEQLALITDDRLHVVPFFDWSSRAVTLRGLPLIRRALCF
jgi:hypothetical protein